MRLKTKVVMYSLRDEWRWQMRDRRTRKIIGASTEGYRRRIDCVRNYERVTGRVVPPFAKREHYYVWMAP